MEKIKKITDGALFLILLSLLFALPSFFSKMCYSHCLAPKEFAIYVTLPAASLLFFISIMLKKGGSKLKLPLSAIFLALYIASLALSFINTNAPSLGLYKFHYHIVLGVWFILFFYMSYNEPEKTDHFLLAALLSGVFPALVILCEAFGFEAFKIWQNIETSGLTTRQAYVSTFGNPDFAAPFFGIMCLLNIRFLIYSEKKIYSAFLWPLQFLYASALLIPLCRSSIIAFIVSLALYFFIVRSISPKRLPSLINVIVSFAAIAFAIELKDILSASNETLFSRAMELFFSEKTTSSRLYMLNVGLEITKNNFWLGAGLNTMLLIFPYYAAKIDQSNIAWSGVPAQFNPQHLHNEFFNIMAESGFISLLLFSLFITALVYYSIAEALKKGEKSERLAVIACAVVFIIVDSMFNITMTLAHMSFLFFFFASVALASAVHEKRLLVDLNFSASLYRLIAGLLIILFSLLSAIFGVKHITADWYIMQGRISEVKRNPDAALKCYQASSELIGYRAEPYCFAADILKSRGDYIGAVRLLTAASNVNLSLRIIYELALIAMRHMDLQSELKYLSVLTMCYPRFDEPHYLLGLRYLKEKNFYAPAVSEAEKCFKRALALNAHHISARMSLAEIYYDTLKYSKALAEIDEALKISPGLKNALYLKSLMKGFFF